MGPLCSPCILLVISVNKSHILHLLPGIIGNLITLSDGKFVGGIKEASIKEKHLFSFIEKPVF